MFTKKYTVDKFTVSKRTLRLKKRTIDFYLQDAIDKCDFLNNTSYKSAELKADIVSENSIMYKCKVVLYMDDADAEQLILDKPDAAIEYIL